MLKQLGCSQHIGSPVGGQEASSRTLCFTPLDAIDILQKLRQEQLFLSSSPRQGKDLDAWLWLMWKDRIFRNM